MEKKDKTAKGTPEPQPSRPDNTQTDPSIAPTESSAQREEEKEKYPRQEGC